MSRRAVLRKTSWGSEAMEWIKGQLDEAATAYAEAEANMVDAQLRMEYWGEREGISRRALKEIEALEKQWEERGKATKDTDGSS